MVHVSENLNISKSTLDALNKSASESKFIANLSKVLWNDTELSMRCFRIRKYIKKAFLDSERKLLSPNKINVFKRKNLQFKQ